MKRVRIFCKNLGDDSCLVLDRSNSHYIIDVLRCKIGDDIEILTEDNRLFKGSLDIDNRKYIIKDIIALPVVKQQLPVINLYMGIIKGSGFDYAVEKASELGATSITPVYCKYSSAGRVSLDKIKRFEKIAQSSALQCGRIDILKINTPIWFEDIFNNIPYGNNYYLEQESENKVFSEHTDFSKPFNIFSGPEGGFSKDEIAKFKDNNISGLSLGPNILRAETIPLVICAQILYEYFRRNNQNGR